MTPPVSSIIPINVIKKQIQCTVLDYRTSEKPEPITKTLTLLVERCSGSSEAFCIQLTQDADLAFLFREEITQSKFKTLAHDWRLSRDLRDDMKGFFQGSLREMVNDSQMEAKAILPRTGNTCTLELETPEGRSTLKITIELGLIGGEGLTNYLMDSVRNLKERNKKLEEETKEKKKVAEENVRLREEKRNLADKVARLESELNKKNDLFDELEKELDEKRNDLQLAEENVIEDAGTIEDLRNQLSSLEQEVDEAICDIDNWKKSYELLEIKYNDANRQHQEEVDKLNRSLKKYDDIVEKYHSAPVSVSEAKVRELEESHKEKDSIIESLKKENSKLTTSSEELLTRNSELSKKLEKYTRDLEKCKQFMSSPLTTNLYSPQMIPHASPPIGSPYLHQSPIQPVYMPPQVGAPFYNMNRSHTPTSKFAITRHSTPRIPTVPQSMTETPILEEQKRKLLRAAQTARLSENIPLPQRMQ